MSLDPFLRFLSAAQASSRTDQMPRRVRRASFAFSQVAASSRLGRASCADEELAPGNFVGVLTDFSQLEALIQLRQPVGQDVLAVIVLRHCVYDGVHFVS